MTTTEDRLRAALRHKAATITAHPQAKARVQQRVRRTRRRLSIGVAATAVATAAAATATLVYLPSLDDDAGRRHALASPATSPKERSIKPMIKPVIEIYPPTSAVVRSAPFGQKGPKVDVWYSTLKGAQALCWAWASPQGDGGCHGTRKTSFDDIDYMVAERWRFGFDGEVSYGPAEDRVKSVTAQLSNGQERSGVLLRVRGFANQVWQVGVQGKDGIAKVVLKDGNGTVIKTLQRERKISLGHDCPSQQRPSTGAVQLASAGDTQISATWTGGCLYFWSSDHPMGLGSMEPAGSHSKGALLDGGAWWDHGPWWYGITGTDTARVEIQSPGGRRAPGTMTTLNWKNERVKLFAGILPQELQAGHTARRHTVIGYGSDGKVLWRMSSPLIPQ